jgi:valyl-tRNA synthetase
MDKSYQPQAIEQRWYDTWERRGYFRPSGQGPSYCIMLPPPNVTGSLHLGHAFQDTLMDALIRYHRMKGDNTLWQGGTDHAGIATQMVVERQLAAQGISRPQLGREAFVDQIWRWKAESGGTITRQLRRLGASIDWSRERFTLDEGLSQAVREVFVRLYQEGLIYRGKRLVNWDPVLHTAVSDLEVVSQDEQGYLWYIRYPLAHGTGHLVVATTRPETLLGDAAVAVHPEDERYQHLIGRRVELPLTGRTIPIIADEYVDREFGTGCLKITPAHDFNDYQVWLRHRDRGDMDGVPHRGLISILTPEARLKADPFDDVASEHRTADEKGLPLADQDTPVAHLIPEPYRGLDRFEARKRIVADLEAAGLLEKTVGHRLPVPRGDRSHAVLEPLLTDQWYVRVGPLAQEAIRAVEDGRIKFVPENWAKTYFEWMYNIQDWCISRQLWWGHRIPAWYDPHGAIYVGYSEADVRRQYRLGADIPLTQDPDVLDTWFSSALWPFSTLGWPNPTLELKTFYPTSVLVTSFDIIFFWVARMIMMGLKFAGDVPFREVYIHGLVRDAEGHKMSKSKGNILDPIDLIDGIDLESLVAKCTAGLMQPEMAKRIEQATRRQFPDGIAAYGTDALRFTFAALAATGRDIKFDLGRVEGYRNFCNKLWNAARYVGMNTEGWDTGLDDDEVELSLADRWISSRLQRTVQQVTEAFQGYRFDLAAQALYEFTWGDYCDWYLELSKPVLVSEDSSSAALRGTRHTLVRMLEALLRLMHPIMPFITEELWQRAAPLAGKQGETIMHQPYPVVEPGLIDPDAEQEMEWLQRVIVGVRTVRAEMNLPPGRPLPLLLQPSMEQDRARVERHRLYLMRLARLSSIDWLSPDAVPPPSATALAGELKLFIPMADLVDKEAELARLSKEIAKISKDLERSDAKLGNPAFSERAPGDVVQKERQRVSELSSALAKLKEQYQRVEAL